MVVGDHAREKLLGKVVVAEGVDLEGQVDVLLGRLEDGFASCNTSIVDKYRGVAEGGANGGSGGRDGFGRAEVALEEANRWWCWWVLATF